eukprot:7442902-Pyramimonas_sp.AAC.2
MRNYWETTGAVGKTVGASEAPHHQTATLTATLACAAFAHLTTGGAPHKGVPLYVEPGQDNMDACAQNSGTCDPPLGYTCRYDRVCMQVYTEVYFRPYGAPPSLGADPMASAQSGRHAYRTDWQARKLCWQWCVCVCVTTSWTRKRLLLRCKRSSKTGERSKGSTPLFVAVACRALYSKPRPMNLTISLERDNLAHELRYIHAFKVRASSPSKRTHTKHHGRIKS